ncbi:MAG: histidine phosphatase family protein [Ignavibacteriaceae bacterium]|nr:histidine phosphatase family protein [Ignavibacteriaceae bacterium]
MKIIAYLILFLALPSVLYSQDDIKTGIRTIYLIRHGEYNQVDTSDSDIGKKLTPLGIAQARLLSSRLKVLPVEFTSLTSSTMTRARETAMVINQDFPELQLKQDELICECTPPSWRKDLMAGVDTTEKELCIANIEQAFNKYFVPSPDEKDRHDLIVCHGNVIRYLVTKVLNVDPMSWLQMSITNCSLTIIRVMPDGKMKLDTFSDYGHIPENMRTFTGGENEIKELVVPKD